MPSPKLTYEWYLRKTSRGHSRIAHAMSPDAAYPDTLFRLLCGPLNRKELAISVDREDFKNCPQCEYKIAKMVRKRFLANKDEQYIEETVNSEQVWGKVFNGQ